MDDRDWDNYIREAPGTIMGETATRQRMERQYKGPDAPSRWISDPTERPPETSFEESIAQWIFIGAWAAIGYYGIQYGKLDWYWPVGFGLLVGFVLYKLFQGPLRFLLTGLKYLLLVGAVGVGLALIVHFWEKAG